MISTDKPCPVSALSFASDVALEILDYPVCVETDVSAGRFVSA
ncbi:hypothetical protein [Amycolatopsis sp. NPDC051372]